MEPSILNDFTALGLVGLMIVLGYYAVNKFTTVLQEHLERANDLQMQTILTMEKCAQELSAIKDSLHNAP